MGATAGAQNCNSFADNLQVNKLPQLDSITYQGIFNSHLFKINNKLDIDGKDTLDLDYSNFSFNNPITKTEENYISFIIKTKYDGIGARKPIDLTFVLDKSGSMSSKLGSNQDSCISVAKKAIIKLIDKMLPEDRLSLVTVDMAGTSIFISKSKEELNNQIVLDQINAIQPGGGTDLNVGYIEALKAYNEENYREGTEKRIIFSTDMNYLNDSTFENSIKNAAEKNIFTTILGIGVGLDSNFLERIKSKGFNYFSATSEEQLKDIIIDNFEYNYFPIAHNLQLDVKGKIEVLSCYGSDYQPVKSTKEETAARNEYSVVKINSFFPSPIISKGNNELGSNLYVKGGLILIKYKNITPEITEDINTDDNIIEITLSYQENSTNPNYIPEKNSLEKNTKFNFSEKNFIIQKMDIINNTNKYNLAFFLFVFYSRSLIENNNISINSEINKETFDVKYLEIVKKYLTDNLFEEDANELNSQLSKLYELAESHFNHISELKEKMLKDS